MNASALAADIAADLSEAEAAALLWMQPDRQRNIVELLSGGHIEAITALAGSRSNIIAGTATMAAKLTDLGAEVRAILAAAAEGGQ